jgi:hypothetical protein
MTHMVSAIPLDADLLTRTPSVRDVAPSGIVAEHSLLRTASPGSGSDSRWLAEGVNFVPTLCTTLHTIALADNCDFPAPPEAGGATYQTCPGAITFKPFIIEVAIDVRFLPTVARQDWISERLVLGLSQAAEAFIWPGSAPAGGRPWLGGGTTVTVTGTGAKAAAGAVEAAILAAQAGTGTLHVSPALLAQLDLVDDQQGTLRTRGTGAKVVVGNYPKDRIAGHIGNIDLYLGDTIYTNEAFERTDNHMYQHAWIDAAVAWHTCAAWVATVS